MRCQARFEQLTQGAEKKVYIKADANARYGAVVEVLNGVRDAGIQNIAFIVDDKRSDPQ
jgi:biopolymer transport protein ExbD